MKKTTDEFKSASRQKPETGFVEMPKTKSGKPRFPSRSDGAEAGIVTGGLQKRKI